MDKISEQTGICCLDEQPVLEWDTVLWSKKSWIPNDYLLLSLLFSATSPATPSLAFFEPHRLQGTYGMSNYQSSVKFYPDPDPEL